MGCYWTNFAWNSDPNVATGRAALYSQCAKLTPWEVRVRVRVGVRVRVRVRASARN